MSVYLQSINQNWNSDSKSQPLSNPESKTSNSENENSSSVNNISVNVSKDLVAAAGFNVETPIVNAIIGNITGTLPTKKNEVTETIKCEICDCEITSSVILDYHINGSRHKKRVKALGIIAQLKQEKGVHADSSDSPNAFRCKICCLTVNSAQQLEFHLSGAKHKKKAFKANGLETDSKNTHNNGDESVNPPSPKKKKKEEHKTITCDTCNINMNSQIQYDQHVTSKKHKVKLNKTNTSRRNWTTATKYKQYIRFKSGGTQNLNPNSVSNSNITLNPSSDQYNSQNEKKKNFSYSNISNSDHFYNNPYFTNYKYNNEPPPFCNFQVKNNFKVGRSSLF